MFFEKFVNSKFYYILDQIVRVLWLNVLTLFFSLIGLVLFGFGPAILAGVYVVKLMINKYEGPITRVFFKAFKRFYKKATIIFVLFAIFIGLFSFNLYYYITKMNQSFLWFDFILFLVNFLLLILAFPAMVHSLLIYSCYESNSIRSLIIDGFKLSIAFIVRGLIFVVISFVILFINLLVPVTLFLVGLFLYLLAIELVLFRAYDKISFFGNISNERADELSSNI